MRKLVRIQVDNFKRVRSVSLVALKQAMPVEFTEQAIIEREFVAELTPTLRFALQALLA